MLMVYGWAVALWGGPSKCLLGKLDENVSARLLEVCRMQSWPPVVIFSFFREHVLKSYIFKVVIEDDQYEDGRQAFRAFCPAFESVGASSWGDTREEQ